MIFRLVNTVCTFLHELIRPNAFKNIELSGYWQSYLYFDAYREEIREIFTGRNETLKRIAEYFTDITKHILSIIVHHYLIKLKKNFVKLFKHVII